MRSKLVGAYLTLRYLGLEALVKESLRRVLGKPYKYKGLTITRDWEFRLLRTLVMKGFRLSINGFVEVETPFGRFRVRKEDYGLLTVLGEDLEQQYGVADVKGGVVVDIGALIGETALFFLSKGARKVYAYEPIRKHCKYLLENIQYNGAVNRVIAECKAVWYTIGVLRIPVCGAGSGLCTDVDVEGFEEVETTTLCNILSSVHRVEGGVDLVKMDCEGCEKALLYTEPGVLRVSRQYIVETHFNPVELVKKMENAGFESKLIYTHRDNQVYIYYFKLST